MMTSEVSLKVPIKVLTSGGIDHGQRLRQDDQPGALPIGEAERVGRLDLALWDRLQSAAHDLGEIGGGEQDERDLRPQQFVDRHARSAETAAA